MGNQTSENMSAVDLELFPFLRKFFKKRSLEFWKVRVSDGLRKLNVSNDRYPLSYVDPIRIEEALNKNVSRICKLNHTNATVGGFMMCIIEWINEELDKHASVERMDHLANALFVFRFMVHRLIHYYASLYREKKKCSDSDEVVDEGELLNQILIRLAKHFEILPNKRMRKYTSRDNFLDVFLETLMKFLVHNEVTPRTFFCHYEILNLFIAMFSSTLYFGCEINEGEDSSEEESSSEETSSGETEEEESEGESSSSGEEETESEEEEEQKKPYEQTENVKKVDEPVHVSMTTPPPDFFPVVPEEPHNEDEENKNDELAGVKEASDQTSKVEKLEDIFTSSLAAKKKPESITRIQDGSETPLSFYEADDEEETMTINEKSKEEESSGEEEEGETEESSEEEVIILEKMRDHNIFLEAFLRIQNEKLISKFVEVLLKNVTLISTNDEDSKNPMFHPELVQYLNSENDPFVSDSESSYFSYVSYFITYIPSSAMSYLFGGTEEDSENEGIDGSLRGEKRMKAYVKMFSKRKKYLFSQVSLNVLEVLLFYRKPPAMMPVFSIPQNQNEKGVVLTVTKPDQESSAVSSSGSGYDSDEVPNLFLISFKNTVVLNEKFMELLIDSCLLSTDNVSKEPDPKSVKYSGTMKSNHTFFLSRFKELKTDEESLYILLYLLITENHQFLGYILNHPEPSYYLIPILKKLYVDTTRKTENFQRSLKDSAKSKSKKVTNNVNIFGPGNGNNKLTMPSKKSLTAKKDSEEYTKEFVWLQMILMMILSQHELFSARCGTKIIRPEVMPKLSFYNKLYTVTNSGVGCNGFSMIFILLLRNIQWSVGKKREYGEDKNRNFLSVLSNLSANVDNLHQHASERVIQTLKLVWKRFSFLVSEKEKKKSKKIQSSNLLGLLELLIEIINSILVFRFDVNFDFIYHLLYESPVVKKVLLEYRQFRISVVDKNLDEKTKQRNYYKVNNILRFLEKMDTLMVEIGGIEKSDWTVEEIKNNVLFIASQMWKNSIEGLDLEYERDKMDQPLIKQKMKYQYTEHRSVEEFFFSYIWSMIVLHTEVCSWKLSMSSFELPFLNFSDVSDSTSEEETDSEDEEEEVKKEEDMNKEKKGKYANLQLHSKKIGMEGLMDREFSDSTSTDEELEILKKKKKLSSQKKVENKIEVDSPIVEKKEFLEVKNKNVLQV